MLASFKGIKKNRIGWRGSSSPHKNQNWHRTGQSEPATGKRVIFKLKDTNPF